MSDGAIDRARLVQKIREDLRKEATYITPHTIERIMSIYDQRMLKLFPVRYER